MLQSLLRALPALFVVPTLAVVPAAAQVVATIDGEPVEAREYEDYLLAERGEIMSRAFAEQRWLERRARELGVEVAPAEVQAQLQEEITLRVENAFGGDASAWVAELEGARSSELGYRRARAREIELELLAKGIVRVDRVVPEDLIRGEWEADFGPNGVRARVRTIQIAIELVTPPGGWPAEERRAAIERAQAQASERLSALLERVRAGSATFSDIAAEHSDHPSAADGGTLDGYFDPVGWPSQVVDAVTSAPEGGLTEPIAARGGVWAFQVVSRVETPYDTVREQLLAELIERGPGNDEVNLVLGPELATIDVRHSDSLEAAELDDRAAPALFVDGVPTSIEVYGDWLRRNVGEEMLVRYAEKRAIEAMGAREGIEPTPEEVERRVDENLAITVELQFKGDYEAWEANLASNARTLEGWRREARRRARLELIAEEILKRERTFSEDELRSAWLDRYGIDGVEVDARLIAKEIELPERLPDEPERAWRRRVQEASEAALARLGELAGRIEDGEDFAALAERFSDDAESARLGGRPPGGFDVRDWSEPTREALLAAPVGALLEPRVEGDMAVLLEVLERVEVPFESVEESIREELRRRRLSVVDLAVFRNVLTRDLELVATPAMFE